MVRHRDARDRPADTGAAVPQKGGRWRARNWRLRTKMTVVLLVPTLTALSFAGLRIYSEVQNAKDFQRVVGQIDATGLATEVVHRLQAERALVVQQVEAGRQNLRGIQAVTDQYARTDDAIGRLQRDIAGLDVPSQTSRDRYDLSVGQLQHLIALRNLDDGGVYPAQAAFSAYTSMIDPLVQLAREVSTDAEGAPSRVGTATLTLGQAKENGAQLDALLLIAAERDSFGSVSAQNRARSADAGFDSAINDFVSVATPEERQTYSDGYSGPEVDRRRGIAQTALIDPNPAVPLGIDITGLKNTSIAANDKLRDVEKQLIGELRGQAVASANEASDAAKRDAIIVLVALAIALLLMLRIARSVVSPLQRLRREALNVAREKLPAAVTRILADPDPLQASRKAVEPVPVFTTEEIGQVARSFDTVHEEAIRMATEQALLRDNINSIFINLSRRSQTLIERQLSELDALEQNEQDPDQLSRFFVLDHLAARMRRNSENLLILSGAGLVRRVAQPVAISEVIEAAVSEIEQYTRVRLRSMPDLRVQGRVVNDLVHLIAELLDNAVTFSPPDTEVQVAAKRDRAGNLAVHINDSGMGLAEEELAEANANLTNPPEFDVSISRRMGLYVVARLAKRHDITVRLHCAIGSTTAVITAPAELLSPSADLGSPITDPQSGPPTGPHSWPHTGPHSWPGIDPVPAGPPAVNGHRASALVPPPSRRALEQRNGQEPAAQAPAAAPTKQPHRPGRRSRFFQTTGEPVTANAEWEQVRSTLDDTPEAMTPAELPKRVPKSQLVPGAASAAPPQPNPPASPQATQPAQSTQPAQPTQAAESPATESQPAMSQVPPEFDPDDSPPATVRTAQQVRSRLSGFQQGLARGRHAATTELNGTASSNDPSGEPPDENDGAQP